MAFLRVTVVVLFATLVSGCINSGTLVKVKPDGSGTIEQTLLVNAAALKGLMSGIGGATGEVKDTGGVLNEAEFKRSAERIGARPVSLTPLKEGGFEGAKALYAFDDITKIRVDQDPQLAGSSAGTPSKPPSSKNPIKFAFARQGANSVLTITVDEQITAPGSKPAEGAKPSIEKMDPAMLQMVKTMFQGFKVLIDLEVDGKIIKTNADYVNGSRVTLLELDMATLFENEAALTALQSKVGPGASIAEVRPYLKDIKGVKINDPNLTIEFR
ncbi:MAG: hypothetical protein ACRD1H_20140 [Vicinamibacterales bacterium]